MNRKLAVFTIVLGLLACHKTQADEKQHRKAAEEYLELTGYKKQLTLMTEDAADTLSATNPEYQGRRAAILRAYGRVYSYEKVKPDLISLFSKHFTAEELKELIKFYKSPVGKKLSEKQPEISKEYIGIFKKLTADDELNKAIQEEIARDK